MSQDTRIGSSPHHAGKLGPAAQHGRAAGAARPPRLAQSPDAGTSTLGASVFGAAGAADLGADGAAGLGFALADLAAAALATAPGCFSSASACAIGASPGSTSPAL